MTVAYYLGLTRNGLTAPRSAAARSFHDLSRHAAAAVALGLCERVLIARGESGRSGVECTRNVVAPTSLAGQFEQLYGPMGPPTLFTIPVLRFMKICGLTHEQLALVSVVQREWTAKKRRNQLGGSPKLGHYRVHFDPARGRKSRRNAGVDISSRVRSARRRWKWRADSPGRW